MDRANSSIGRQREKDFYVGKHDSQPGEAGNHFHNTYEIWYLLKGEDRAFVDGNIYEVKKGDMLLIDRNKIHKINVKRTDNLRLVLEFSQGFVQGTDFLNIDKELLNCFKVNNKLYSFDFQEQSIVEALYFKMIKETKKQDKYWQKIICNKLEELLIYLNRKVEEFLKEGRQNINPDYISSIIKYLNKNYKNEISLDLISDKYSLSKSYLCKIFKENTGFTINEYLNLIRIKRALYLLKTTELNVTDIANQVGYNSGSQFYRMFGKITETTPNRYRKENVILSQKISNFIE